MAILGIQGVGRVEVYDAFLKKLPEEQQKEIDYIGGQGRTKSVAADMMNRAKACDYSSISELARETVSNIPPQCWTIC